jgi:zona occludens toxin (predicted ATPase)
MARNSLSSGDSSVSPFGLPTHKNISSFDFGAHPYDAALVKISQSFFRDIWNFAVISSAPRLVSRT